ncbi:NAD(P)-binding protein [Coprinellus micaceus]|uniref:NAD(P)-binding protein n=1 Tax=Coprinellus micaceus TaxID=71717 RepID=A0A4Y7TJM3_COPMI|nr:NAD(P)-binding protein [Coprinellus micaceus]
MKAIVTGASGVLGSAVRRVFESSQVDVLPLSFSRTGDGLVQLDLTNRADVRNKFAEFKPEWVIHCAAERRPDVAEQNPEGTKTLNSEVPGYLAELSKELNFTLVYISTDYVFDGTNPPYSPRSTPNPLNLYGKQKRGGEEAILSAQSAQAVVLRVPILYGPAPKNTDSAVNCLLDIVHDRSGKKYTMDHFATRYPTNVIDIAKFLRRLTDIKKPLPEILHYSGDEPYTKYEMCLVFAKILELPHDHIIPNADPPSAAEATSPASGLSAGHFGY